MKSKKWVSLIIGTMVMIGSQVVIAKELNVYIDGHKMPLSQPLINEKGITYVPVRAISEALGAKVFWHDTYVDINIQDVLYAGCEIGSNKAYTRDGDMVLEGKARVTNGTTYVPLRFVSEALGAGVDYKDSSIYIDSKSIENKINSIKTQEEREEEGGYNGEASANPHFTHNALYTATGEYDAASNKWIYTVFGENSIVQETVIYDIEKDKWSLLDDESALEASIYAQYICPGDRDYIRNYKDNTITEDFTYQYKADLSAALFGLTFSEQQAEYYTAWGMFKIDFATGTINCIRKPLENIEIEDKADFTVCKESITPTENEPKMPDLPSDLDIDKLPITTLKLQTKYHARLRVGNKSKEVVIAYKIDGQDFVVLKDVQSLISGVTFNQAADGKRTLSYQGKTVVLTKKDYQVLAVSNKIVINSSILQELGITMEVQYI